MEQSNKLSNYISCDSITKLREEYDSENHRIKL